MSPQQADLLKRLIAEDRTFHAKKNAGIPAHSDERDVEVGWINDVNPRTANSLVCLGLAEIVRIRPGQAWIFLGSYHAFDEVNPSECGTA
jgi:hypothetical protein